MSINTEVMQRMVRAFVTGELADVESFVDVRYIDHQGLREISISGPNGFRKVVSAARGAYADLEVTIEDLIVDSNKVVARLRWKGRSASDGVTVSRETIDILRVESGRAVEHWGSRLWMETE